MQTQVGRIYWPGVTSLIPEGHQLPAFISARIENGPRAVTTLPLTEMRASGAYRLRSSSGTTGRLVRVRSSSQLFDCPSVRQMATGSWQITAVRDVHPGVILSPASITTLVVALRSVNAGKHFGHVAPGLRDSDHVRG